MAYGGPDQLSDVEPFLLDIRGGRPTSAELVEEIRDRYAAIGGRSPLLEITRAQAAAVERELNTAAEAEGASVQWQTFVGMRHWHPYIAQTVEEIVAEGFEEVVVLCLAPQFSTLSIGAYFRKLDEALEKVPSAKRPTVARVPSWGDHPTFLEAVAEKVEGGLGRFSMEKRRGVKIVFSAHSLPRRILAAGDPYEDQLRATAAAVAERTAVRVGHELDWTFCYQSAGAGAVDWLGPQIEEVVPDLARSGHRDILIAPVGFVADHVEVLFDLDIEARTLAEAEGARLERTESLNTSPTFIRALAEVIRAAG